MRADPSGADGALKPTPRQKIAYDLRHSTDPPMGWTRMGKALGMTRSAARSAYLGAYKKIHGEPLVARPDLKGCRQAANAVEVTDPEKAADAMVALSAPEGTYESIADIARQVGISPNMAMGLQKRMNGKFLPLKRAMGEVKTKELGDLSAHNAWRIWTSIKDEDIENASLQQKSIAGAVFFDKHQIAKGEPTQIFSAPQLDNLDKLTQLVLAEAKRRQIAVSSDPHTQETRVIDVGGETDAV